MYFRPVGVPTKVIETWVGRADLGYLDAVTFSKGLDVIEYLNREQARLQPFDMDLEQAGMDYNTYLKQLQSSHSSLLSAIKSQALAVMIFNSREYPSPHEIPAELQVITVGDGELGGANDGEILIDIPEDIIIDEANDPVTSIIDFANDGEVSRNIPKDILIHDVSDPITSIVDFTYPNLLNHINDPSYFQEKAILAPTNEVVDSINGHLLKTFPGEEMVYLSCDSVDKIDRGTSIDESVFSTYILNGLKFSGANHRLAHGVNSHTLLIIKPPWTAYNIMKKMDYHYEKNMRYDQLRDAVSKRKPGWEYLQEVKILESFRILGFEHGSTYSEIKKGIYETQFRIVKVYVVESLPKYPYMKEMCSLRVGILIIKSSVQGSVTLNPEWFFMVLGCIYQVWVINWIYSQLFAVVAESLVLLLSSGADQEPKIIEHIFTSWSYIMMYLQKHVIKRVVYICPRVFMWLNVNLRICNYGNRHLSSHLQFE
ncbi:hypothetical protein CTI12_AA348890 [Artemisia annua]|uniref:Uncharacterized protein n=1 Tax=Artemisia annua TaxID=35608 RepID=A0A2U1MRS2_ARTAN|nr:hypothetical protein CTI12_AA348890 [Artemisia annua]